MGGKVGDREREPLSFVTAFLLHAPPVSSEAPRAQRRHASKRHLSHVHIPSRLNLLLRAPRSSTQTKPNPD